MYIVDGDFYILNGNDRQDLKGLFVLPRYCIENFLIDKDAIIQLAYEESIELDLDKIVTNLNFEVWLEENEKLLLELFIIYALCYKYIPNEQTIGYKVNKLCSSNVGIVCPQKIDSRVSYLKNKLIAHMGQDRMENEFYLIKERIKDKDIKLLRFVSGKDYLLPLIITRLQSFIQFPHSNINLRIRLAMKSDVDELKNVVDYIFE